MARGASGGLLFASSFVAELVPAGVEPWPGVECCGVREPSRWDGRGGGDRQRDGARDPPGRREWKTAVLGHVTDRAPPLKSRPGATSALDRRGRRLEGLRDDIAQGRHDEAADERPRLLSSLRLGWGERADEEHAARAEIGQEQLEVSLWSPADPLADAVVGDPGGPGRARRRRRRRRAAVHGSSPGGSAAAAAAGRRG